MTTDRPYRKALAPVVAFERLEQGRGTQWDPAVVGIFLDAYAGRDDEPVAAEIIEGL